MSLEHVLAEHEGSVWAVMVTEDGTRATSGSGDRTVRVWDLTTGECLHILKHENSLTAVAVTPDETQAISGSLDGTMRIWDLTTGECLCVLEGHEESVEMITVTPDGTQAISGSEDNSVRIWDLATGKCLHILTGHASQVMSLAITPDGMWALSGSWDQTVRVWDLATGECLRVLAGHQNYVLEVLVTSDGTQALSSSKDGTVCVWNLAAGECLRVLTEHERLVTSVVVTSDGTQALSSSNDGTVRVWDLATGKCLYVLEGHEGAVYSVAVTVDGTRALTSSMDQTVRVWDLATGKCHNILRHEDSVRVVAVTPDGMRALSGSGDLGTVCIWDLRADLWDLAWQLQKLSILNLELFRHVQGEEQIMKISSGRSETLASQMQELKNVVGEWRLIGGIGFAPGLTCIETGADLLDKKNQKDYRAGVVSVPELYWPAVVRHIHKLGPPGKWTFTLWFTREEFSHLSEFIREIDPKAAKRMNLIQADRTDTATCLLLRLEGVSRWFLPLIKAVVLTIESDRGDIQDVRFTDFLCKSAPDRIENWFLDDATFKLDAEYRVEPEAVLDINKVIVEYEENLFPQTLEQSVQALREELDQLIQKVERKQEKILELITRKLDASLELEPPGDTPGESMKEVIREEDRSSVIPPEAVTIFNKFQNQFEEPLFEPLHLQMGGRFAGLGKFVESIMAKLIVISFIPSLTSIAILLVSYAFFEEFVLTWEFAIELAGYGIVFFFVLSVVVGYFMQQTKKQK